MLTNTIAQPEIFKRIGEKYGRKKGEDKNENKNEMANDWKYGYHETDDWIEMRANVWISSINERMSERKTNQL